MGRSHSAVVEWERAGAAFIDNRYSRGHRWRFDGGVEVPASASPQVVRLPWSVAEAVDPEEAFVAALASCHMLWFLSIAAGRAFMVDTYRDEATGVMGRNAAGRLAMAEVTLRPRVAFAGDRRPSRGEHEAMHEEAHERCYLANSVTTAMRCEPLDVTPPVEGLP
jgi:organic hydroperoxide reductase OsmC/OhrA